MANAVNRYFEGLLVGGTLGFVIGLLTAPKPGAELRRELADSADDMLKNANTNLYDLKDKMSDRVAPLADKAGVYKERMMTQASTMRTNLGEKASSLKEQIKDKADVLKEKAGELKEKAGELKDKAVEMKDKATGGGDSGNGADLLNNYMGNNSGPMYTAGHKADPNASTMPVSDACSNYSAGKAGEGASGG